VNDPISARHELEGARASLENAAKRLQRAGNALQGDHRAAAAIALGDCEYTNSRVCRLLNHLRMGSGAK
jgi:hypothetical protein